MDKTNALALPGTITEVALILPDGLLFSEWEKAVNTLSKINRACQWWIGDAVLYGESNYGEKYAQVLDATGFDYETVKADKWVSGSFSVVRRRTTLSWSHHREVAALEPDEQDKWLDKAEQDELTREELRRAIRTQRQFDADTKPVSVQGVRLFYGDMLDVLPMLDRSYDLVIADSPYNVTDWDWDKLGTPQQFLDRTAEWLNAIMPKLQPAYNLFWFCSPRYAADVEIVMRGVGLPIQSRLVWHRRNMAMGSDTKKRFIDSWEMIYHCGNRDLNLPAEWNDGRFDVQTFAVPQTNFTDQKLHPTQKPLELIRWLVDYGSFPGDKILDPFAGSGTTGAATSGTRDCDLIESNDEYAKVIEGRLNCVRT